MQGRKSRFWILLVVIGACLGLAAWAFFHGQHHVQYRTIAVERGNMDATISATGNPNAVVTVQVGSQVSGNIMELDADFNSKVRKGQLIARIDPQIFQARVDQARATVDSARSAVLNAGAMVQKSEADVASAQANVAAAKDAVAKARVTVLDAKAKLGRRVQLAAEGVLSKEDRETAQATYDEAVASQQTAQAQQTAAQSALQAAQAQLSVSRSQQVSAQSQVKQAQASLEQAQIDLDHTYIRAPVDGTVVSRKVDVGQTVAASLAAPTLFEIAQDLTKMQVDTNVDEADVGKVRVGQTATFTVDAYPNNVFRGEVTAIRKAPINTQNVITYDVVVSVANPDLKLFPGMTANVKILVDRRENALKVPNAALRFRPPDAPPPAGPKRGGQPAQTVWVLTEDGKAQPVPVKPGLSDGMFTEVKAGNLHEGDKAIVGMISKEEGSNPALGGGSRKRGPGF